MQQALNSYKIVKYLTKPSRVELLLGSL